MKLLFVLCLITLAGLSVVSAHSRGCISFMGKCIKECEEGTHVYGTGCGYLKPEATCDNPNPRLDTRFRVCDYTSCYCDPPTVRDTATGKCVSVEECSMK